MRRLASLVVACCVSVALAREEHKKDFLKTAALPAGGSFRVDHSLGSIAIRTHASPQAAIRAVIRCSAPAADQARDCADGIQIAVEESASGVSVRTIYPRHEGRSRLSFGVNYDIALPETAPLDVRNRFGNVSVSNLKAAAEINNANGRVTFLNGRGKQRITNAFGDVEVRTNEGDLNVNNQNGKVSVSDITGFVDIANRFGSIDIANAGKGLSVRANNTEVKAVRAGGTVSISNSFGRVTVIDANGDVTVRNQNGEVAATGVAGAASLDTSFSPIRFSKIGRGVTVRAQNATVIGDTVGGVATVETSFGGVELRDIKGAVRATATNSPVRISGAGQVYAKTTFNGVTITDTAGPITVEAQNSSVSVEPRPGETCQPILLSTSFGPIRVALPRGAGYNLIANTSFGRIRSEHELTVSGEVSNNVLNGRIGSGGCELRLSNRNGNVDIVQPGTTM